MGCCICTVDVAFLAETSCGNIGVAPFGAPCFAKSSGIYEEVVSPGLEMECGDCWEPCSRDFTYCEEFTVFVFPILEDDAHAI